MDCVFDCMPDDKKHRCVCRVCGAVVVVRKLPVYAECGAHVPLFASLPRLAVGDFVERLLAGIGITKERVQYFTRADGCGCGERQRWLNQWGYRQQDRLERLLNMAARWCGIS
jgi:hypothetical protein